MMEGVGGRNGAAAAAAAATAAAAAAASPETETAAAVPTREETAVAAEGADEADGAVAEDEDTEELEHKVAIDRDASEFSLDEGEDGAPAEPMPQSPPRQATRSRFIEDEAEESEADEAEQRSGASGRDSESGEEEEEGDERASAADSFLDDRDDAELGDAEAERRRKRRREATPELAEGDIELLREAGVDVPPSAAVAAAGGGAGRLRRLKRLTDAEGDAQAQAWAAGDEDDDGGQVGDTRSPLPESMSSSSSSSLDESDFEEDEFEDFIDYGEGERARRQRRRALRRQRAAMAESLVGTAFAGVDAESLGLLRELFGEPAALQDYRGEDALFEADEAKVRAWLRSIGIADDRQVQRALQPAEEDAEPETTALDKSTRPSPASLRPEQLTLLEEMYATARDDQIRDTDVPERLQLHYARGDALRPEMDESDLRYEAEWIATHGFARLPEFVALDAAGQNELLEGIVSMLRFVRVHHYDVPYIAMYCREYLEPHLLRPLPESHAAPDAPSVPLEEPSRFVGDWQHLWRVLDWDRKYTEFMARKRRLMDAYEERHQEELFALATGAFNQQMLRDVERYARLRASVDRAVTDADAATADNHRPRHRNRLHHAVQTAARHRLDFEALYGLRCGELAANVLAGGVRVTEPADQPSAPLPHRLLPEASEAECARALMALRYLAAAVYASHPRLRNVVRGRLRERARLHVHPSERARTELDVVAPLRAHCSIAGLPVAELPPLEYAQVLLAQRSGYVEGIEVALAEGDRLELCALLEEALLSDKLFEAAQQWNAERKRLINEVMVPEMLLRPLLSELQETLAAEATESLREAAVPLLERQLGVGGVAAGESGRGELAGTAAGRVLTFVIGTEAEVSAAAAANTSQATRRRIPDALHIVGVAVDARGEPQDTIRIGVGMWLDRAAAAAPTTPPPPAVQQALEAFMARHEPYACVAVGYGPSGGVACARLHEYLREMESRRRFPAGHADAVAQHESEMQHRLVAIDEDVARLYEKTRLMATTTTITNMAAVRTRVGGGGGGGSSAEAPLQRRAIGLARLCQEPLAVWAAVASEPALAPLLRLQQRHVNRAVAAMTTTTTTTPAWLDRFAASVQGGGDGDVDALEVDAMLQSPNDRHAAVQRALAHAIACVGLDLNLILQHRHLRPLLHFAAGLGVRKAPMLLAAIESRYGARLPSRKALTDGGVLSPRVAHSLIGFVRVRDVDLDRPLTARTPAERAQDRLAARRRHRDLLGEWNPLDDTRIHPDDYPIAERIAREALQEVDKGKAAAGGRPPSSSTAVQVLQLMENPHAMDALDLMSYAAHLRQLGKGLKRHTLRLLEAELQHPFQDWRDGRVSLRDRSAFYACTGLDERRFAYGTLVHAYDVGMLHRGDKMVCRLVTGGTARGADALSGYAMRAELLPLLTGGSGRGLMGGGGGGGGMLSASAAVRGAMDADVDLQRLLLADGGLLRLRVKAVVGDRVQVELMAADPPPAALVQALTRLPYRVPLDGDGDGGGGDGDKLRGRAALRSRWRPRQLNHPSFYNISGRQAVERLLKMPVGEAIFRPSPRDVNALCASFRVHEQAPLLLHVEVHEEGPRRGGRSGPAARLRIGDETYEDLDEVQARYVEPLVQYAMEAARHPKFLAMDANAATDQLLTETLRQDKARQPSGIPYRLVFHPKYAGCLQLAYLPGRQTILRETIGIAPEGYRLRGQVFGSVAVLLNWFKRHWRQSRQAAAAAANTGRNAGGMREPMAAAPPRRATNLSGIVASAMEMAAQSRAPPGGGGAATASGYPPYGQSHWPPPGYHRPTQW